MPRPRTRSLFLLSSCAHRHPTTPTSHVRDDRYTVLSHSSGCQLAHYGGVWGHHQVSPVVETEFRKHNTVTVKPLYLVSHPVQYQAPLLRRAMGNVLPNAIGKRWNKQGFMPLQEIGFRSNLLTAVKKFINVRAVGERGRSTASSAVTNSVVLSYAMSGLRPASEAFLNNES